MKLPTPRWLATSVRNKLLAMALLPLLVVFPLLVLAIAVWSSIAYDRLLITKVRSDLAVARGYFDQTLAEVGSGTRGVARSQRLLQAMAGDDLGAQLAADRQELGLDFLLLFRQKDPGSALPASVVPLLQTTTGLPVRAAQIVRLSHDELAALAPQLLPRLNIPLVPTRNASPDARATEDRALVLLALQPVLDATGQPQALLVGGLLLNQNLDFIDHINRIVYPDGALPFGSEGTATLFLDDVRITTNVRLFQDQRAIGTRVSQTVRDRVLGQGETWLDRAFVVNDWYVSAYEPLLDAAGQRVGMLYVGFLESPFRWVRHAMLAVMGLIFLGVMAVSAMLSVRWARSIFRPVEQMNRTMQRVEDGDSAARVGPLPARDELGGAGRSSGPAAGRDRRQDHRPAALGRRAGPEGGRTHAGAGGKQRLTAAGAAAAGQERETRRHRPADRQHRTRDQQPIASMQGNLDLIRDPPTAHREAETAKAHRG